MPPFSAERFLQADYAELHSTEPYHCEPYSAAQWTAGLTDDTELWPSLVVLWHPAGDLTVTPIEAFTDTLNQLSPDSLVLLASQHSHLPSMHALNDTHQWLKAAGQYRQAQCRFKHQGGLIASFVTDTLIGGTYLVHGLGAQYRMGLTTTQYYPSLSPDSYARIFRHAYPHPSDSEHAVTSGLIQTSLAPNVLWQPTLARWVATIRHLPLSH